MAQSAPEPFFPSEEVVPESMRHLQLRTALYVILDMEFEGRATVGSDQFVYWDRRDPKQVVAPDAIVQLGTPLGQLNSWKTWEHGVPNVCVEIVSDSDAGQRRRVGKLQAYQALGVKELVRFDPRQPKQELRQWLRREERLVLERSERPILKSPELGLYWLVQEHPVFGRMLRLARDPEGLSLLPTPQEARAQEAEARTREAEARVQETEARMRAEARVRELEAALRKKNEIP